MSSQRPPAVVVDGVSKSFRLPREQVHTLKEKALHPFRRAGHDTLTALSDVSFAVKDGEFFGILGRNGSGKSTLLKCLAGIYRADAGQIYHRGRVSTFIELGVGFNPDLAAYDNVMLNATMLGLSTREARRRFDQIIEFAELEGFVDLKLKNYSSGMLVRLAFSVMIQVDADILLIDEVLAVGDAAFQQKCFEEFGRIRRSGTTVLLVTHDMGAVQRFCDRALLLEHGRAVELAEPEFVADRYLQLNFSEEARAEAAEHGDEQTAGHAPGGAAAAEDKQPGEPLRLTDGTAEIVEAWFEDEHGTPTELLHVRSRCSFHARVRFHARLDDPLFGVSLLNSQDDYVWGANNLKLSATGVFEPGDEAVFSVSFDVALAPDRYWATPALAPSTGGQRWHDRRHRLTSVMVTGTRDSEGLLELPFALSVERTVTRAEPVARETA